MEKYSDNELTKQLEDSEYSYWLEWSKAYEDSEIIELSEKFDNDEIYEEYVNIEKILKRYGM